MLWQAATEDWEWASVLLLSMFIAVLVWLLCYGTTLIFMGMAVAMSALQGASCGLVSGVFTVAAACMFMIPAIPANAVYLSGGIMLVPTCGADADGVFTSEGAYWGAVTCAARCKSPARRGSASLRGPPKRQGRATAAPGLGHVAGLDHSQHISTTARLWQQLATMPSRTIKLLHIAQHVFGTMPLRTIILSGTRSS